MYRSIERHGYRPARFGNAHPTPRFLVDGHDWRFVLRQGHHRVAALRVSGATHVLVKPVAAPMVVDGLRLTAFTRRRGGLYDDVVAEKLFRSQFDENGTGRMHELGLSHWLR